MDIRVLKYFLAVVREQNISKASQSLHITQPTLSRQLMDLENELHCKLFERSNRNIQLTDKGLYLYKRAEEIITLVDKTTANFHCQNDNISGDIYIGCGETANIRLFAKIASKLYQKYPQIHYHLISGNTNDLIERLDKGIFDFCLFIEAHDIKKYNYLKLPLKDTWGVLMRKDSSLAKLKVIKPKNLWDLPLIFSNQAIESNELSGWIQKNIDELNIVATYNLIYNASFMVEEGLGYAITLDKLINTSGNSKLCFIPLSPKLEANIQLAWKKHQIFSKPAKLFLNTLQEELSFN